MNFNSSESLIWLFSIALFDYRVSGTIAKIECLPAFCRSLKKASRIFYVFSLALFYAFVFSPWAPLSFHLTARSLFSLFSIYFQSRVHCPKRHSAGAISIPFHYWSSVRSFKRHSTCSLPLLLFVILWSHISVFCLRLDWRTLLHMLYLYGHFSLLSEAQLVLIALRYRKTPIPNIWLVMLTWIGFWQCGHVSSACGIGIYYSILKILNFRIWEQIPYQIVSTNFHLAPYDPNLYTKGTRLWFI